MLRSFLLVAFVTTTYGAHLPVSPVPFAERIIGGSPSTIEEHPYQVGIVEGNSWRGSGTLVKPRAIVTSVNLIIWFGSSFAIRVGSSSIATSHIFQPSIIHYHPLYKNFRYDYDIAVIGLSSSIADIPTAAPIAFIAQDATVPDSTLAEVSGWGETEENTGIAATIHTVEVPIVNQNICSDIYNRFRTDVTSRMLCAGRLEGGAGYCRNDFGSPLVVNNVLVGIASWSVGCGAQGIPQVYTRISAVSDWITETLSSIPE